MRFGIGLSLCFSLALLSAVGTARGQQDVTHNSAVEPWQVVVTDNFRIYHRDPRLASSAAAACEQARFQSLQFWFPDQPNESWNPRCEVFLCDDQTDFRFEARASLGGSGQAAVVATGSRILYRKIVVRSRDSSLIQATLPHEVSHVVIGSRFAGKKLPVWIDEGMAAFSEPETRRRNYLASVERVLSGTRSMSLAEIVVSDDYPDRHQVRDFYAGSYAVCDYLVYLQGKETFINFLGRVLETNSESALLDVYGIRINSHLESRVAANIEARIVDRQSASSAQTMP